jgi:hypothetical protein
MATRVVEWKKPYTWGKAIEIDENKVISLRLRDENNLIIWDEWDNEIYVDLQLDDEIQPIDAFPIWVNTWRVIVDNWWDLTGTIISAVTTSGDNIKLLYADNWTLWIDNWTWIFKQIYLKWDVDTIIQSLQNQIDILMGLGKFLSIWDCSTWLPDSFPLALPYDYHTWDWYLVWVVDNTVNYKPEWAVFNWQASTTVETDAPMINDVYIYDGTTWMRQANSWIWWWTTFAQIIWQPTDNANLAAALNAKQDVLTAGTNIQISNNVISATWWSDIVYATQAEYNALLPWAESDWKHYFIYSTSGGWWWQPWANTLFYFPLKSDILDYSWNNISASGGWTITYQWWAWALISSEITINYSIQPTDFTASCYVKSVTISDIATAFGHLQSSWWYKGWNIATNIYNSWQPNSLRIVCLWASPTRKESFTPTWWDTTTWHLTTFVKDGTNSMWYFYIDGSLAGSKNLVWTASTWNYIISDWTMYVWDVIFEDKCWTAQEIQDYYDQTKWDYWIS